MDSLVFLHDGLFWRVWAAVGLRLGEAGRAMEAEAGRWLGEEEALALARSVAAAPRRRRAQAPGPVSSLTRREREVLRRLGEGQSNRVIAEALFISEVTVKNHISGIFAKLGVESRAAAVAYAHRNGLV